MVEVDVHWMIVLENIPQATVITLPNVETLSLHMTDGLQVYDITGYISCPRARRIFLGYDISDDCIVPGLELFPSSVSWRTTLHQFAQSPVEEVTLEIESDNYGSTVTCYLTLRSLDTTVIKLTLRVSASNANEEEFYIPFEEMHCEMFARAHRTIRDHPLLSRVKRLRVRCRIATSNPHHFPRMADEVGRLFNSVGPLDEFIIHGCDLHIYVTPFLHPLELGCMEESTIFPPTKELTISHPLMEVEEEECFRATVELAKSQHTQGIPFDRVTIRAEKLPVGISEELERWVDTVNCYEEKYKKE